MTDSLASLIAQLQDAQPNVRSKAALGLGQLGDPQAIEALIGTLCHDPELNVQEDATWALVRIGAAAVEPLIHALSDPSAAARHNAAHTLGKIGDGRAVDGLIGALRDGDAPVRLKAAYALGQIGDGRAAQGLVDLLADPDLNVRWMAVEVLERLKAVEAVLPALGHAEADVREQAAAILGLIGDRRAAEGLIRAARDETWEVRVAAIQALGEIGDQDALLSLGDLRDDPDARVRAMVTKMLNR
ncbi:MAG: HEAT repeat domain-containing protein [Anaerolineae bacterium]|nr:HEAT repeat domain-containing protein [Anaerolineae bacterium]